jgi:hypothetical protein
MKKHIAKMLRRAAQHLDPVEEPQWFALYPTDMSTTTNVKPTYAWQSVGRRGT